LAAVVKTMNMLFQPLLTLPTRASTIWLRQRMMSSRISTAYGRGRGRSRRRRRRQERRRTSPGWVA
jgi:hypothetical protein